MAYLFSTPRYHLPILSGIGLNIPGAPQFVDPQQEQVSAQTIENQLYGMIKMHNGGNGVIIEGDYENLSTTEPIVEVVGIQAFINQIHVYDKNQGFVFSGITPQVYNYLFLELTEQLDTFVPNPSVGQKPDLVLGTLSSRRLGDAKTVVSLSPTIGPNSILISRVILDYQGYGYGGYGQGGYGHSPSSGDFFVVDVDLYPPGKIHLTSVLEHAADNTDPHGPILIQDYIQSSGIGVAGTVNVQNVSVRNNLVVQNNTILQNVIVSGLTIFPSLEVFGPATFSGQGFLPSFNSDGDKTFQNLTVPSGFEILVEQEDFEDGVIPNTFTFSGDQPWFIDNSLSFQGVRSARSGVITDSQTSTMSRVINVSNDTTVRVDFYYNVSSEAGIDKFTFLDNAVIKLTASGVSGWVKFSLTLQPGSHTLQWTYTKDSANSFGRDAVNIDLLTFTRIYNGGLVSRQTSIFRGPVTIQSGGILKNNLQVSSGITIDGIDVSTLKFLTDGSEADNTSGLTLGHTHSISQTVKNMFFSPEFSGAVESGIQLGRLDPSYDGRNFYRWNSIDQQAVVSLSVKRTVPSDFLTFSGITVLTRTSAGLSNTSGIGFTLTDSVGNSVNRRFIKRPDNNFTLTRLASGIPGNFIRGQYFGMKFDFYGELGQTVDLSEINAAYFSS